MRTSVAERTVEHISGIVAGQVVPVTDNPLLTSASTQWSGFLLEVHSSKIVRQDVWWGWHRTHVCLVTRGMLSFEIRRTGRNEKCVARKGNILIFPAGFDETHFCIDESDFHAICVELDPVRLKKLLGHNASPAESPLQPQIGINDRQIHALLTNMATEVSRGCPTGKIYGQSLSLSLAAYLEGTFREEGCPETQISHQFSELEAKNLSNYILENLDNDLCLATLAELVGVSPRQFCRLFGNTFGTTPHRYIMDKRIARAKTLIREGGCLVNIANKLGFSSQSHFSDVFRKTTGVSPGRFRARRSSYCVRPKA
jgi:AraC family transcriptional regulator